MLGQFLRAPFNQLTLTLKQGIVLRYQRQKSIFDTTSYNPDWIPRERPYHKLRKPRQAIWSDSSKLGPYQIPPLRTIRNHKQYLREVIENETREKLIRSKEYLLDAIRPGDIVDITNQETYENDATVTHRCFVLSFKRRNQLTATLEVIVRLGGMNIKANYMVHSPKVKNIKLVSKGSGNFKSNLKDGWEKVNKDNASRPRIRNRVMKNRTGIKLKEKKAKSYQIEYDQIKSDNIKRIIKNDF